MYVPNFNFHFTLESSVQKEAMQAKKKKKNYNDFGKQHMTTSNPLLMCGHLYRCTVAMEF